MRIEGWEKRLAVYLEAARPKTFAWGSHDCALWSGAWVKECTGQDFISDSIGLYSSEAEARTLMKTRGFTSYASIADSLLLSKPIMLAQRGDLVLGSTGALGICNGLQSFFVAPEGLLSENTLNCQRAWQVG